MKHLALFVCVALVGGCATTSRSKIASDNLPTGARIHYAERGAPTAAPLILLHGYSDSWHSYDLVLDDLARTSHVYALTLRGHGDSSRPTQGYGMADHVRDVLAFMRTHDIERADVIGHSMGSFVAMELALTAPERVASLVLVGTGAHLRNPELQEFAAYLQSMQDPINPEFVREFQESTMHNRAPDEFVDQAVAESLKVPALVWRQAAAAMMQLDFTDDLPRIVAPTLLIRGAHDEIFDESAKLALSQLLPNATEIVYEETGHAPHWERPRRFVQDVRKFLAQTRRGR